MGTTAKIRHRRARARRLTAQRWFTEKELVESGLYREIRVISGDELRQRFFLDARSAERVRAKLAKLKAEVV
jgi:hypothetical protein